ncbi:MAG: nucleotide exchange factor GrpE [Marinilabiliales bacterium]|nr:MAG: nucleotide exchange factor GrpE [Marinilabiliales bacterium]
MAEKEKDQEMNAAEMNENPAEDMQNKDNQDVEDNASDDNMKSDEVPEAANAEEDKSQSKKKSRSRKNKSDKLADENEELRIKLAEAQDKYLRLFSEFDNFRKRSNKEKLEILSSASGALIKELLPVMDDMDRAQENFEKSEDVKALAEGVELIFSKFRKTLAAKGLEAMESTGAEFDTDIHEAIAQFPAPDESQKNKIIDTTEKGYTINGKVIRHAKVVVGV